MPGPARHFRSNNLAKGHEAGEPLWKERAREVARGNNEFFREARARDHRASPPSYYEDPGDADVRHAQKGERKQAGSEKRQAMRYIGDEGRRVIAPPGTTTKLPNGKVVSDDLVLRAKGVTAQDRAKAGQSLDQFAEDVKFNDMIESQRREAMKPASAEHEKKVREAVTSRLKNLYDNRKTTAQASSP